MEPWGRGFESPVFESEFTVLRARAVGNGIQISRNFTIRCATL